MQESNDVPSPTQSGLDQADGTDVDASVAKERKSVGMAYLLCILFGPLDVHNSYLGRDGAGALELFLFCGGCVTIAAAAGWAIHKHADAVVVGIMLAGALPWGLLAVSLLIDVFKIPGAVKRHTAGLRQRLSEPG